MLLPRAKGDEAVLYPGVPPVSVADTADRLTVGPWGIFILVASGTQLARVLEWWALLMRRGTRGRTAETAGGPQACTWRQARRGQAVRPGGRAGAADCCNNLSAFSATYPAGAAGGRGGLHPCHITMSKRQQLGAAGAVAALLQAALTL